MEEPGLEPGEEKCSRGVCLEPAGSFSQASRGDKTNFDKLVLALKCGGQLICSTVLFVLIYQSGIWFSIPETPIKKYCKVQREGKIDILTH